MPCVVSALLRTFVHTNQLIQITASTQLTHRTVRYGCQLSSKRNFMRKLRLIQLILLLQRRDTRVGVLENTLRDECTLLFYLLVGADKTFKLTHICYTPLISIYRRKALTSGHQRRSSQASSSLTCQINRIASSEFSHLGTPAGVSYVLFRFSQLRRFPRSASSPAASGILERVSAFEFPEWH